MRKIAQSIAAAILISAAMGLPAQQTTPQPAQKGSATPMATENREVVDGIGGLFFRAKDPKMLAAWYHQHLGIGLTPTGKEGERPWRQEAGDTAFSPFSEKSTYFEADKQFMMNFRVHNLDRMVAQLRADGIEVKDPETYAGIGKFTRIHDPEGNPIELWQPEK